MSNLDYLSLSDIEDALGFIPSDERDLWIKIGMALYHEYGDSAFSAWDAWSQMAPNYDSKAAQSSWKSIARSGGNGKNATIASVIYEAKQRGWKPNKSSKPDPAVLEQHRLERETRRLEAERLAAELAAAAASKAQQLWQSATFPIPKHPYLDSKSVGGHGLRHLASVQLDFLDEAGNPKPYTVKNALLVAAWQDAKNISSLQIITSDGKKRFLLDGAMAGAYAKIGDIRATTPIIVIAEGYATGATIYEVTSIPVVLAFVAGNIHAVASKMRNALPNIQIIYAVDNDQYGKDNAGVRFCTKAADEFGGRLAIPEFDTKDGEPTDWNDFYKLYGSEALKKAFLTDELPTPAKKTKQRNLPPHPDKNNASQALKNDAEVSTLSVLEWRSLLECTDKGVFHNNLDNVVRVIEHDPDLQGRIWYDTFLNQIVTNWQGAERVWGDEDDVLLQLYVQRHIGLTRIGVNTAHDAVLVAAFRSPRNECQEYLLSVKHDGVSRLAQLMSDGFGADDNEYTQAVGRCWFTSMVARVMAPGCKVDTVPVFEGSQGRGKSSALSIIGGKWFSECHESVLTKDFYGQLDGHMLVEISEMHSFTRAEVERVKGIISCQVDKYRKAYGRNTQPHPRKTVLACTTNRDDWQRDDTGARRFWPIACGDIDLQWLSFNRDQLFAEAVAEYQAGNPWWDVPVAEQEVQTENRRDADIWENTISDFLIGITRITTQEIISNCLKIELSRQDQLCQKRVARVMRGLKWNVLVAKEGGRSYRVWVKNV